jgi:hypothetical protein
MTLKRLISNILLTEPDNAFDPSKSPANKGSGTMHRQAKRNRNP